VAPLLNGHGLGRRPDAADPRDYRFAAPRTAPTLPASVDLRAHLPGVWDQGETNACGAFSAAALMQFLFPEVAQGFSRNQIYYAVRELEGDLDKDDGVQTRSIFKVLEKTGAAPENVWPSDAADLFKAPPASVAQVAVNYRVDSYERLVGTADYLGCLAAGLPFVMGFLVPESLDSNIVDRTGILPIPDLSAESIVGGHDVLVVGYDQNFKDAPFFKTSAIDPKYVDDTMLLVRNSWGPKWSPKFRGHFWMPLSYATNPTTGGDAWSAKRAGAPVAAVKMAAPEPVPAAAPPAHATPAQLDAAFATARKALDGTGYGGWVKDATLRPISDEIANAVIHAA